MGSVTQGISEAMNEAFISMATSLAQLFGKKNRVHKLPLLINVEVLKLYMMSKIWIFSNLNDLHSLLWYLRLIARVMSKIGVYGPDFSCR